MDPEKLKVVELRTELSQRGLDTKGVKSVLVERLRKALEEENASQKDQGKANTNTEDSYDSGDEKPVPQTPKKSSRLSKNAPSITTSRETPATKKRRTSRLTSYSRKRTSPKKSDQNDTSREPSPISESALLEETGIQEENAMQEENTIPEEPDTQEDETSIEEIPTKQQEEKPISVERHKEAEVKESCKQDTKNEGSNLTSITEKDNKAKDIDVTENNTNKENVSQTLVTKSPVKSSEIVKSPQKKPDENTDNVSQKQESVIDVTEKQKETSERAEVAKENENIESKKDEDDKSKVINEKCNEVDNTKNEVIEDEEKNTEKINEAQIAEPNDVEVVGNVNDTELPSDDLSHKESHTNENENSKATTEDQILEDKDDALSNNEKEVEININEKQDEQDIEMTEIKHEEDTDVDMREQDKNDVIKDRKRKRSPSPLEDRQDSPTPLIVENEPEIDDSALILSWYDSDLNLVIDKEGFFTATPMYSDGFLHMWAGARASYGFLCGKVYYEAKIVELCPVDTESEEQSHILRVGWSTPYTTMQLGEEKFSFGYSSTRKKLTNNKLEDYGLEFSKDDIIGCYLDATSEKNIVLSYTVNGKDQGSAFNILKEELGDKPLFPHILSKNCTFACNFGQEKPWATEVLQDYVSIGNVDSQYKIPGPRRPEKKEDCEVIMMCGLPASGKTTWAIKHAAEHPQKMYNILGLNNLIDKIKDPGLSHEEDNTDQWEVLVDKCTRALEKLLEVAPTRRRNYILDQTHVYPSVQRRKMKNFSGYQRKAIVVVPSEEEYKLRAAKHKPIESKELTDNVLMEMKANFRAPIIGESFDIVEWIELNQEEGEKLVGKYNKEAKEAGYGRQETSKRPRIDSRPENVRENRNDSRSNREGRDYRDRRGNNYSDRNRNSNWRGGGWRDRPQRGGHVRHGGGYGPPAPWRGRGAPIPLVHRGIDRRGSSVDRRNDRGRAMSSRQGGWAPMGNYQGSQQSAWNQQQNNWSSGQSQGNWGQQNNWGSQQWGGGNWKSYGQGSYNQTSYQQQGYGSNGNWNSWNQQYYNQYWGQQQQQGGQTSTSGGQATNKQ
ncbi:uncharacterized protein LOC143184084 [Calliopsis andreniformis]|uniref:uncharacterized protein LOC143184084 n=1 Tax=Calliopsis andreniformis TaxID=337506 RepID=UPI003FCCB762